jgi:NADPH:quinone reductase-like Zn-dependent oxidoreductase
MGGYGQYFCVPASATVSAKPANMTYEEAAAVPLGGLNALHFMRLAEIQPGDSVLVNGAGGSIGMFAVQIAKAMGAEVTAVDGAHKEAMLRSLGIDHFIDYKTQDFAESDATYDVVFNMVATRSFSSCMEALKPGGHYLTANPKLSDMLRSLFPAGGKTASIKFAGEKPDELRALTAMIEKGIVRCVIDRVLPMSQAAEAHRLVETEERLGSIVLGID